MPKYLVINCEDSKAWTTAADDGCGTFADMFRTKLSRVGDTWSSVNTAANGDEDTLSSLLDDAFDGVVITGSHYNIRDNRPWFASLCELICTAAKEGYPRIYGGCFGCQIIAHALGGHVDRNPNQKFILRAESVTIDVTLLTRNLIPGYSSHHMMMRLLSLNESSCAESTTTATTLTLKLLESHGDCVCDLPPEAIRLGTSTSCVNEMFIAGKNNNILGCQSHPEFDLQLCIYDRILPAVMKNRRLSEEERIAAVASFDGFVLDDSILMLDIISSFLHHEVREGV